MRVMYEVRSQKGLSAPVQLAQSTKLEIKLLSLSLFPNSLLYTTPYPDHP